MGKGSNILASWLITLIISPMFFILASLFFYSDTNRVFIEDILTFYFLFIFIGMLNAIPCLILLILINFFAEKHPYWNKITISFIASLYFFLSFLLTDRNYYSDINIQIVILPLVYSITFIISIFYLKKVLKFYKFI